VIFKGGWSDIKQDMTNCTRKNVKNGGRGWQRTDVGCLRTEDRGQRTEDGGQITEDRAQISDVGGLMSDVGYRMSEVGRQRTEGTWKWGPPSNPRRFTSFG